MNITSKLNAIKKASSRRQALVFHSRLVGGVSVIPDRWQQVSELLKQLFKELKKRDFCIDINHWGEIILTEPERRIQIFLSIRQAYDERCIHKIKTLLSKTDYVEVTEHIDNDNIDVLFQANRQGAKRRSLQIPQNSDDFKQFIPRLADQLSDCVSGLVETGRPIYHYNILEITEADILCVLKYGAIKLGPASQFAALLKNQQLTLTPDFEFTEGRLFMEPFGGRKQELMLTKPSHKLLSQFFIS